MLTKQPAISVVIPVYNGAKYLRECLDSVFNQTFVDFEVLIRDDCSSDESRAIIESYADSRLHYIAGDRNLRLFGNVNYLIRISQAPLIRVLCQDDILEPDALQAEMAFFEQHTDVAMTYCKARSIDEQSDMVGEWPIYDVPEVMAPDLSIQLFYYHGCILGNLSTACVRRDIINELGYFDEQYIVAGDYEMWVRICRKYNLGVIHKYTLRIRQHERQLSRIRSSVLPYVREYRQVRDSLLMYLPSVSPSHFAWFRLYPLFRHDVLDVHLAIRLLLQGDVATAMRAFRLVGIPKVPLIFIFWFLTINNRLYRPLPRFA